jgi:hypothetical protein
MRLGQVAELNVTQIDEAIAAEQATKRRQGGPIQLKRRDNTPVVEPPTPPPAAPAAPPAQ